MSATALQTAGFVSGVIGTTGVFAATLMDVWCARNQQEHKLTSTYSYKGLWKDCEVSSSGFAECQSLYSHLNYSELLKAIRALMVVAILVGVISVFIGFFCLKCLKMRSMALLTRAKLMLSTGILFIIAGLCDISGASVYADQIVPSFMMTPYNQKQGEKGGVQCGNGMGGIDSFASKYTFGPALYIAWVGGALLLLGGILKCIAFKRIQTNGDMRGGYIYNAPAQCRAQDEESHVQRVREEQRN